MKQITFSRYYELIGNPLQILMKRIGDGNDCNELAEKSKCTNNIERFPFEHGNDIECNLSDELASEVQNEASNANDRFMVHNEQLSSLNQERLNGERRQTDEDGSSNGKCHDERIHGQNVDIIPSAMDLFRSSNDTVPLNSNDPIPMQQASDNIEEPYCNFIAENTYLYMRETNVYSDLLCDNNYNCLLVMEAIEQLEKDNQIEQQRMNVQSAHITTTNDLQVETPARPHCKMISIDENSSVGHEARPMKTLALKQSSNLKRSRKFPGKCNV